jgi:hypothetical protein
MAKQPPKHGVSAAALSNAKSTNQLVGASCEMSKAEKGRITRFFYFSISDAPAVLPITTAAEGLHLLRDSRGCTTRD